MTPLFRHCTAMLSATLLLSGAVKAQEKKQFRLTGDIKGLSGKIYLVNYGGEKPKKDSVVAANGKFHFAGPLAAADLFTLEFVKTNHRISVFLEPSAILITGNLDSLSALKYSGSAAHMQYLEWLSSWKVITADAGRLYQKSEAADKEKDSTVKAQTKAEVEQGFKALDTRLYNAVDSFVQKYPSSPVAPYVIYERFVEYSYPEKAAAQFAKLSAAGKQTLYGKKISEIRVKDSKTDVGVKPAFSMADTANNMVHLSDFKGKYVLVDFWASWCGPCRKENPNVVAAYKKYHDKGFEVLGVSLDNKKEAWLKAIRQDGLTWTHVSDLKGWQNKAVLEYGIRSVPTSFLLDTNGVVIAKNLRGEELHEKLESLLGK